MSSQQDAYELTAVSQLRTPLWTYLHGANCDVKFTYGIDLENDETSE